MFRTSFYREEILKKNFKTMFTETKKTFKDKKAVRNSPGQISGSRTFIWFSIIATCCQLDS